MAMITMFQPPRPPLSPLLPVPCYLHLRVRPMCPAPTPADPPIILSGVGALVGTMETCFNGLVWEPAKLFHKKYQFTQETKHILSATTPVVLEHTTKDIAAEVNDECAAKTKHPRGIV